MGAHIGLNFRLKKDVATEPARDLNAYWILGDIAVNVHILERCGVSVFSELCAKHVTMKVIGALFEWLQSCALHGA